MEDEKRKGQYIRRIVIDSLWSGIRHVDWQLRPDVNILSGVNGVGKSTILKKIVVHLMKISRSDLTDDGVELEFYPEDVRFIDFDFIRSFDRPLLSNEFLSKITDATIQTELDFHLYQLQRRYLDYQVNLSNRIVKIFTSMAPDAQEKANVVAQEKIRFQNLVDELFLDTGKTIRRDCNEIFFDSFGEKLPPYKLSSGEKQMLIILLSVLVQNQGPFVLFMDEPEISLHVEWQQKLIGLVRELNPNVQVILTTHSPAVIMDGWGDCVTDVQDIIS